ncbi:MAG: nicotinate-nucleotide--dimethylbenzimidazole phosphoribosyltransferase [Actinomycetota bacterium]
MIDEHLAPLFAELPSPDAAAAAATAERASHVLRPRGAFARLDEVACWLAGWQRTSRPTVERPAAIVFVADHGVADEGVSAYPQSVSEGMLRALQQGVATASVMAEVVGASLEVVDVGVGRPTGNLAREPALSHERFAECLQVGRDAVRGLDCDLLVLGEMGIGNTTAAAAVCAALFGLSAEDWAGRGTGLDAAGLGRKIAVIETARRRVGEVTPLEALRQVGGAELASLVGATLEARAASIPVVLDGFVVTAAVAPLYIVRRDALDHCIAGHCSAEPGHRLLLEKLAMRPLLDLDLRLGEGTGALAAVPLIRIAAAAVSEVATFAEWGLS